MTEYSLRVIRGLVISFVTCFAALLPGCGAGTPEKFIYRDQSRNEVILIDGNASTISDGHIVQGFARCDGDFVCLKSVRLFLVVPKAIDNQKQWSADGRQFRVVGKRPVIVGNKTVEAYKIESAMEGVQFWFDFNPELGLIAFGATSSQGTGNYRIEGKCGYGAAGCRSGPREVAPLVKTAPGVLISAIPAS